LLGHVVRKATTAFDVALYQSPSRARLTVVLRVGPRMVVGAYEENAQHKKIARAPVFLGLREAKEAAKAARET